MPLLSIISYENKLKKGDYHEIYKTNIFLYGYCHICHRDFNLEHFSKLEKAEGKKAPAVKKEPAAKKATAKKPVAKKAASKKEE